VNVTCATPMISFSWTDALLDVDFTNTSATATSFFWDFGDGNNASVLAPSYTYAIPGTYTVCLLATNDCGTDTLCQQVVVTCPLPTSAFTYVDTLLDVAFLNDSTNADSVVWDMGDGASYNSSNPDHTYSAAGTYTVCLVAYNTCGSDTTCQSIVISCPMPQSDFIASANSLQVDFTLTSTNSDASSWNFGDGNTSAQPSPTHTYAASGIYYVCLDDQNTCGSDSYCDSVTVIGIGLAEDANASFMLIYPNPSDGRITLELLKQLTVQQIQVHDVAGRLVFESAATKTNQDIIHLDLSFLPTGMYNLSVRTAENRASVKILLY
jgi:PKD repeat protein